MRIAVNTISTKMLSGGVLQIAYNFLLATLKYQDDIEWYYITSADVDELVKDLFESIKGTRYFVFPTQPDFKGSYQRVRKDLVKWEDEYKPDVIYTISAPCYFTFKTKEVLRFANAWVTNPNKESWKVLPMKAWFRMRLYRLNQIRMLKKARFIITQSQTVRKGLIRMLGLPADHVKVIPNVLPHIFAQAEVSKKNVGEWIDVNCAAAPVPHKNLDIIPKVLLILRNDYGIENVRFHLTIPEGNSLLYKIRKECTTYGMGDKIINHGRCTQQQLIDVYNQCDLCFLPTLLETFSASSLEAMYFGQLIVATDYEFNKEIIEDAGLYYKPMDAEDAAEKIFTIITDIALQDKLRKRMVERLMHYNNYNLHFRKIVDYLKEVCVLQS